MRARLTADRPRDRTVLLAGGSGFSDFLRPSLATENQVSVIVSAANANDAVTMTNILAPDVVLVDPDMSEAVSQLSEAASAVVVLSVDREADRMESAGESEEILGVVLALASLEPAAPSWRAISLN